jgi:hypothetical protein
VIIFMSIRLDKKKLFAVMSGVKCVNSVTYLQNYVTLVILIMFNFVRQVLNMIAGNEKYYKTELARSTSDYFSIISLKSSGLVLFFT